MSRHALILERVSSPEAAVSPVLKQAHRAGEYTDLIRRLIHSHTVVALVGSRTAEASRGIAAELAASGKRVVIVDVQVLTRLEHTPDPAAILRGRVPNVFRWPAAMSAPVDFFPSSTPESSSGGWLDALRSNFDAVLLDCPTIEIACMADAAVLVVDAGKTTRQQIKQIQQAVKLAGTILMQRR